MSGPDRPPTDSFGAETRLELAGTETTIYRLGALEEAGVGEIARPPVRLPPHAGEGVGRRVG